MHFFQRNPTFAQRSGSFFQHSEDPQEGRGKNPQQKRGEAPQPSHQPLAQSQCHRAEGEVIYQPAEDLAPQQVEPHGAVAQGQKEKKAEARAAQGIQNILREQRHAPVFIRQQPENPEQVVQNPQREAEAQAEQKQPGLVGDVGQVVHQRNTLPKKPPALLGDGSA